MCINSLAGLVIDMQGLMNIIEHNAHLICIIGFYQLLFAIWIKHNIKKTQEELEQLNYENTVTIGKMIIQQSRYIERLTGDINTAIATLENIDADPYEYGAYGRFKYTDPADPQEPTKDLKVIQFPEDDDD
tara:strand:- start:118 stop:510 length:393 start_codon:yes stop_codon:yes gene_type:complete